LSAEGGAGGVGSGLPGAAGIAGAMPGAVGGLGIDAGAGMAFAKGGGGTVGITGATLIAGGTVGA
jgi:hypothetical protein